jgi:ubiquinone/menaquinone biosynthesis C-methylase UbiE
VADVGSGTGILSALLLESGARVLGVEPNTAMRAAAQRTLGGHPRFESIAGTAEATGLAAASVDLVTAGQAFHWFDAERARVEFARILRAGGWVALVWNQRKDSAFNREYVAMLERFAPDYARVRDRDRAAERTIREFFSPAFPNLARFANEQKLDEAGLRGRLMSSSYTPRSGALHMPLMNRLDELFAKYSEDGRVTIAYDTVVWYGRLGQG